MAIASNIPFGNKAMPVIGFGMSADSNNGSTLKSVVLEAIKLGYRHFNTASAYGSEQALGEGIAQALKLGLVSSWEELFITSKLWPSDAHPDLVLPALPKSVRSVILIVIYGLFMVDYC
jgi:diketogulonate reductase-like aldo/keto reductase